ncbi:GNAT family N-acetyltransferase [Dactylosporangium sp. NPDC000555]|uniref:GNAT family N-acetyltransferase n=1 Tax=Dactylosporangium sp. NPDC000555 TaxID=3154260 RepID=UPI003332B28A
MLITRRHPGGQPGRLRICLEDVGDPTAAPVAEALLAARPGAPVARLVRIEVRASVRGRGLGRRLLREVAAEARAAGARRLRVAPVEAVGWLMNSGFVVGDGFADLVL